MTDNTRQLIPKYAYIPAAIYILYLPVYFLSRFITENLTHHEVDLPIDDAIPLVPVFVWIYILAYLQWFIGYFIIGTSEKDLCYRFFAASFIGKTLAVIIFVVYPTSMIRPEIVGTGLSETALSWIYNVDSPDNLFPSLHCMESWLTMRGVLKSGASRKVKVSMAAFSFLVFASVLLVKQHLILDVFGGILVAEAGLLLEDRFKFSRVYDLLARRAR